MKEIELTDEETAFLIRKSKGRGTLTLSFGIHGGVLKPLEKNKWAYEELEKRVRKPSTGKELNGE